jgi:hypothetical protein
MQSADERRRLMKQLGSESITPVAATLKCAAGILVLVIIAAGPWMFLSTGGKTSVPAAGEQAAAQSSRLSTSSLAEERAGS